MLEVDISDLSRTLLLGSVAYIVWGLLAMLSSIDSTMKGHHREPSSISPTQLARRRPQAFDQDISYVQKRSRCILPRSVSFVCLKFGHHGAATLMRFQCEVSAAFGTKTASARRLRVVMAVTRPEWPA
jgi:hypothetical protein